MRLIAGLAFLAVLSISVVAPANLGSRSPTNPQDATPSSGSARSTQPWIDIRDFGATARFPAMSARASQSDPSDRAIVTLSMPNDFRDGEGIDIVGGGPETSPTQPAAPIVKSMSVKGNSSYDYECVSIDAEGGLNPGKVTTVTDAPNSFATKPVDNTSIERVGGTINIEVSNRFIAGPREAPTIVIVQGAVPQDLNGEYVIETANPTRITANTGLSFYGVERGIKPGTSQVFPVVSIQCPPIKLVPRKFDRSEYKSRTVQYAVYGNSSGKMSYLGMTSPGPVDAPDEDATHNETTVFDWGPELSTRTIPPAGVPVSPPERSFRRMYQGIVRKHLSSSRVVVSPAPEAPFESLLALHDDGPAILAAASAAKRDGKGSVLIPPVDAASPNASFVINHPLVLPWKINVIIAGKMTVNSTITFGAATTVNAALGSSFPCSVHFSQRNYGCIDGTASPQFYLPENGDAIDGLEFSTSSNHQSSIIVAGSQQSISNCSFSAPQTLSTSLIFQAADTAIHLTNLSFLDSSDVPWPGPLIPALWFRSDNHTGVPAMILMDGVNSFSYRGILIDTSGVNANAETDYNFSIGEDQAPSTPLIMLYGGGYVQNVSLSGAVMDTTLAPAIANWSTNVNDVRLSYITTSGGAPQVTGKPIPGLTVRSSRPTTFPIGQNVNVQASLVGGTAYSGSTTGASVSGEMLLAQPLIMAGSYPVAVGYPNVEFALQPATSGTLKPNVRYDVSVAVVGPNGGDSEPTSRSITLSGSDNAIDVRWTPVSNAFGYDIFLNSRKVNRTFISPRDSNFEIKGPGQYQVAPALGITGMPLIDQSGVYTGELKTSRLSQLSADRFAGKGTLENGEFTFTFPTPYKHVPVCTANDTTRAAAIRPLATNTSLVVAGPTGDAIAFICVGDPD
jgi:hypothetical protein